MEMRIPFNQLRFPKKDVYVWGVDFRRVIKRKNEKDNLVWVPKDQTAYVSRFARLEGIKDIRPGRHVEIIPYTVGQAQFKPAESGNPFEKGHKYLGNAGFDLKVGLKSNLTLDATVNPDFGQVEVDPAVINLSAYETYYEEKRPFFIEGASLFNGFGRGGIYINANINWPNPTFFYSRRIGRSPQGYVTRDGSVSFPDRSTILGAFKLTGKVGNGWNVGFVNALTSREYAEVDSFGSRYKEEVEPFSYYGAFRAQKDIHEGQSGYGILATGVVRDLRDPGLEGILNKNALSIAFDGWISLDKKRTGSSVVGLEERASRGAGRTSFRLQNSSMHYYQRPDATHVKLDPEATSLSGWGTRFPLAKQQGRFLFLASFGALSPGFDPNDIGFQYSSSDKINFSILPAYQWTKPGKVFRNLLSSAEFGELRFRGNKIWEGAAASSNGRFLNYWEFNATVAYNPKTTSNSLTRGGPLAAIQPDITSPSSSIATAGKPSSWNGRAPSSAALAKGRTFRRPQLALEAEAKHQPVLRARIFQKLQPDPMGNPDFRSPDGINLRHPLCVRTHRPEDHLGRNPAELDLYAQAESPTLPPAVHRRGPIRPVQGTRPAEDI